MARSETGDLYAQLRQLGRLRNLSAHQLKAWLGRFDRLRAPSAPRRDRVAPPPSDISGEPLPGKWSARRCTLVPQPGELIPQLPYWLYEPSAHHRGPLPLVVMLHGCRQTPDDFAAGTQMNALAEREGFLVAYPQQPLRRQVHRCWQWFDLGATEGGREAQAIATLIESLASRRDVLPNQIYLAGLSAGASMAAAVAMRYPGRIAAVATHSGVVIGAADNARGGLKAMQQGSSCDPETLLDAAGITAGGPTMPALVLHGLDDDAVNPVNARLLARQFLAYNRLPDALTGQRYLARDGQAGIADMPPGHFLDARFGTPGKDEVRLCEIAGLDHAWSGGDESYRFHSSTGPSASALMWEFFRDHSR